MRKMIDPMIPEHSYLIGLLQTDGHHASGRGNKGTLSVEASLRDIDIAHKLSTLVPVKSTISTRSRVTCFPGGRTYDHESFTWKLHDREFREEIEPYVPTGDKTHIISPPDRHTIDYWRGVIDGDGSLGITSAGLPFVSLVTASSNLAEAYMDFLVTYTGFRKRVNRNSRDGVYNIMVNNEAAVALLSDLYYKGCLSLDRKKELAETTMSWVRPEGKVRISSRRLPWSKEEVDYLKSHSESDFLKKFPLRTLSAYRNKKFKLGVSG